MRIPYGSDYLFTLPLIDKGATDFEATPVPSAAGDVKVANNRLAAANPSGKTIAFTSGGTEEILPGQTLTGATSAATCVVMAVWLTSGTWAGGDAAGFLFVKSDSGTFQSENLNNTTTGTSNVATIGAALDAAGLFKHLGAGEYAVCVPGSQTEGAFGYVKLVDQTGTKEWEDVSLQFETEDHPLAAFPNGCKYAFTAASIAAGYARATAGVIGVAYPAAAHETMFGPVDGSAPAGLIAYIASAATGAGQAIPVTYFDYTGGAGELEFGFLGSLPYVPTGTVTVKIYEGSKAPAHVIAALTAHLNAIADAYLDRANGIETGVTPRQAQRAMAAESAGNVTGGPDAPAFAAIGNSGTPRLASTADEDGNRTVTPSLT